MKGSDAFRAGASRQGAPEAPASLPGGLQKPAHSPILQGRPKTVGTSVSIHRRAARPAEVHNGRCVCRAQRAAEADWQFRRDPSRVRVLGFAVLPPQPPPPCRTDPKQSPPQAASAHPQRFGAAGCVFESDPQRRGAHSPPGAPCHDTSRGSRQQDGDAAAHQNAQSCRRQSPHGTARFRHVFPPSAHAPQRGGGGPGHLIFFPYLTRR